MSLSIQDNPTLNQVNPIPIEPLSPIRHFIYSLQCLKDSETSLFLMFLINFFSSLQYYILVTLIPIYFTERFGYTDVESGLVFGAFGIVIGSSSLIISSNIHVIKYKNGLFLSFATGILGFVLMIVGDRVLSMISVIGLQAFSSSLLWPFIEYGIDEYCTPETRVLSSSLFYVSNYLSGIVCGIIVDLFWGLYGNSMTVYYIFYLIGILGLAVSAFVLYFCRDLSEIEEEKKHVSSDLVKEPNFWRFVALIFLLILLRSMCFGHLDATLPKYLLKIYNTDAHFGIMLTTHSITMLLCVFLLTTLTYKYSSYSLIVLGGAIGAVGTLFLAVTSELWGSFAVVLCISIGESIWVPRLLDYTYSILIEGHEGIYLALSNCPFYFGMILTGYSSGILFENFCNDGKNNCSMIWALICGFSSLVPIILVVLRKLIKQPDS